MSANESVIELLREVLGRAGAFKARAMFGGHGLYLDGVFFAILDDGALFFKTSPQTAARYDAEAMPAFTYQTKTGLKGLPNYRRVPERLFDETDELAMWVQEAVRAVQTASAKKKPRTQGARLKKSSPER